VHEQGKEQKLVSSKRLATTADNPNNSVFATRRQFCGNKLHFTTFGYVHISIISEALAMTYRDKIIQ
jgi:hypothetical protein